MAQIQGGTTYSTGDQVTATNLNALAGNAILLPGSISEQTDATTVNQIDSLTILQAGALREATVAQLKTAVAPDLSAYIKNDGSVAMTADLTLFRSASIAGLTAAPVAFVQNQLTQTYVKASTTEVAAFSTVSKYLSPELLPFAFSGTLSTNGGVSFPGGFIMKWGTVSSLAPRAGYSITFPTAFPNQFIGAFTTISGAPSPDNVAVSASVRSAGTTGFTLFNEDTDSTASFYWLAIGQ